MINMSYCRFENTYKALDECLEALNRGESLKDASHFEKIGFRLLFTQFLTYCKEMDFVDDINQDVLDNFFKEIENK